MKLNILCLLTFLLILLILPVNASVTITNSTYGGYNISVFTYSGTGSNLSNVTIPIGVTSVEYLIVGGAGGASGDGGGGRRSGGSGAGGLLSGSSSFSGGEFVEIVIGKGGAAGGLDLNGGLGFASVFNGITATGGGYASGTGDAAGNGGSGGGSCQSTPYGTGIAGQGHDGNTGAGAPNYGCGGGGGSTQDGGLGTTTVSGAGGNGTLSNITGTPTYYAAGGAGGLYTLGTVGYCPQGSSSSCGPAAPGIDGVGGGAVGGGTGSGYTNHGGSGTVILKYSASVTPPLANFIGNPVSGDKPLAVQFTDTSTNTTPISSWLWNFGDGINSTLQNPLHTYSNAGTYNVSLYILNSLGNNTTLKNNYITVSNLLTFYQFFVNVQDSVTGADLTDSVNSALYYKAMWYNDTPPYYENLGDIPTNFSLWRNNPYAGNKNTLSMMYTPAYLVNNEALVISKTGYLSDTKLLYPMIAGTRYIKLIPLSSYSSASEYNFTKIITVYDANGKTDVTPIDVKIRHTPDFEIKTVNPLTGVVYFKNNPCGNFIGEVYNRNTAQEIYNWTFSNVCDVNKKVTNGTLYQKEIWLSTLNAWSLPPLPLEPLYVFAKNGINDAAIAPYTVSIQNTASGIWSNYTVMKQLGDLTSHSNLEAGNTYKIYVNSNGYLTGYKQIFLTVTEWHKTIVYISLYKSVSPVGYTIWDINVFDALTNYPVPAANISVWDGLYPTLLGTTNNNGKYLINITNSSVVITYDIVVSKDGYNTQQKADTPNGAFYTTNFYLTPINVAPIVTPYTPIINISSNITGITITGVKNYCRQVLDWNNETAFSPLTNIEACIGIENVMLQNYILACLIIVICGIFASKKVKSVIGFLIGAIAGNTICLLSGLIEWQVWVIIMLPFVLIYFISKEKIKI